MSFRPWTVASVAALVTLALWWPLRQFLPDDAFIHMQYAKHLRDGHGLVFNLGERVYGTTSPVWSALLGLLGRAGLDLRPAAQGLSLLCALAASALGVRVFARFLAGPGPGAGAGGPWIAACAALAWATDAWFLRWAGSGMETSFAALCVLAGFDRYTATRPWGARPFAPALLWSLAALARPESGLLIVLLALSRRPRARRDRCPGPGRRDGARARGRARRRVDRVAWAYYGTPLPITLTAKSAEYAGLGRRDAHPAAHGLGVRGQPAGRVRGARARSGPAFLAAEIAAGRGREHVVPLGWLVALPAFYMASGVPGVTRYIVPLAPLLVAYGWRLLAPRLRDGRRAVAALAVASGVGLAAYAVVIVPQARTFTAGVEATLADQGRWFKANTPPETRVAIRDIGAFAYYSDRPDRRPGGAGHARDRRADAGPHVRRHRHQHALRRVRAARVPDRRGDRAVAHARRQSVRRLPHAGARGPARPPRHPQARAGVVHRVPDRLGVRGPGAGGSHALSTVASPAASATVTRGAGPATRSPSNDSAARTSSPKTIVNVDAARARSQLTSTQVTAARVVRRAPAQASTARRRSPSPHDSAARPRPARPGSPPPGVRRAHRPRAARRRERGARGG